MGHDFGEGGDDLKMGGFVSYPFLGSYKMGKISAKHKKFHSVRTKNVYLQCGYDQKILLLIYILITQM